MSRNSEREYPWRAHEDAKAIHPSSSYPALLVQPAYPTLFHLNAGQTKVRPAYVLDVAEALSVMLTAPRTSIGSTFVLPGPRTYTFQSMIELVSAMTLKSHKAPILPKPIALAIATVLNRALWWPTICPDEVRRKFINDFGAHLHTAKSEVPAGWAVDPATVDAVVGVNGEHAKSWEDLNITPTLLEEVAITILRRYRSAATFDSPVELGGFKPPKAYHVVE